MSDSGNRDGRLILEVSISEFNGDQLSLQKFNLLPGVEIGAVQEGISDLVQRLMVPANSNSQHRNLRASARTEQANLSGEDRLQNMDLRSRVPAQEQATMNVVRLDEHTEGAQVMQTSGLGFPGPQQRFPDTSLRSVTMHEPVVETRRGTVEGVSDFGRVVSNFGGVVFDPDDENYPVYRAFEPTSVDDAHWRSNNFFRIQMRPTREVSIGWISQVADGISGSCFRTAATREFRGRTALFIWCYPEAELDAVRELSFVVAQRLRPSEHKLQRPSTYIVTNPGEHSSPRSSAAPQRTLGEVGLIFSVIGRDLVWRSYRELRTELCNSLMLSHIQYLEFQAKPTRRLLVQMVAEDTMEQAALIVDHICVLLSASEWKLEPSRGVTRSIPVLPAGGQVHAERRDESDSRAMMQEVQDNVQHLLDSSQDGSANEGTDSGSSRSRKPQRRRSRNGNSLITSVEDDVDDGSHDRQGLNEEPSSFSRSGGSELDSDVVVEHFEEVLRDQNREEKSVRKPNSSQR